MGRFVFLVVTAFILLVLIAALLGCGSSSTKAIGFATPAGITLSPTPTLSIDEGKTQTFTAVAHDASNPARTLTVPIAFHSSNTAVVTIANNGLACAGTWDSLSLPQICTPGPSGVAQITATSAGVSSPPTTIYVHQHIDSITVAPVTTPAPACVSKGQIVNYAASAFSRGADITPTVGQFSWQSLNGVVVTLNNTLIGIPLEQVEATAGTPGLTQIFASAGGVNSIPISFTTCAVQSISLEVSGTTSNSFTVTKGTTKTLIPTVTDSANNLITGVPLTWCSSLPAAISVASTTTNCTTSTSAPTVSTPQAASATIIASCTPPTCNIGFSPTLPIYPTGVINATATEPSGTAFSGTVYVSSTGCGTTAGCISTVVPITAPANTAGAAIILPATPNSLLFGPEGTKVYLGTDLGLFGTRGLMQIDATSSPARVQEFTSVTGKVLAISPNGNKVIISDQIQAPNQVFVFDATAGGATSFQITGATAADFSPDGLKAYILAGNTLYIYSTVDALKAIPMAATGIDVSFLSEGAFAYIAGQSPSTITVRRTCDNAIATDSGNNQQVLATPGIPSIIKTLPDATHVLAVDSPGIDLISLTTAPTGCQPPVSDSLTSFNLGQGTFVPTQLIISPDGSTAYLLTSNLGSILVFSIANHTSSAIPLAGNATPIRATLVPDGTMLYVAASDGTVHAINTVAGGDVAQVSFSKTLCIDSMGNPFPVSCTLDLIAVKP